jgi:hypothetical protein
MRKSGILIAVSLAALAISAAAPADEAKKNAKFCASLTDFDSGVAALQAIGPTSTVKQLRTAADRVEADANKVLKAAGKIKSDTAKQFTDSARQLRKDASAIPDTVTIEQAHSRIDDGVQNVKRAARQLATESGCPAAAPREPVPQPVTP